jgi:hypothetical protein
MLERQRSRLLVHTTLRSHLRIQRGGAAQHCHHSAVAALFPLVN